MPNNSYERNAIHRMYLSVIQQSNKQEMEVLD